MNFEIRLNGRLYLIQGSHDRFLSNKEWMQAGLGGLSLTRNFQTIGVR